MAEFKIKFPFSHQSLKVFSCLRWSYRGYCRANLKRNRPTFFLQKKCRTLEDIVKIQGDKILEREYHIRKHKITLHEQLTFQHIVIDCVGNVDEQIAHEVCKVLANLLKQSTETIHFLIDLNQSRETTLKARRAFRDFAEEHIQGRMAFCGLHPVAKVLAGFFLKITNKQDMRFFKTRNEAIKWLRSG